MPVETNLFESMANSIIKTLTYIINTGSGILQLSVYFLLGIAFSLALIKAFQSLRALAYCDNNKIKNMPASQNLYSNIKTPLSLIAASFFEKAKKHYSEEKESSASSNQIVPPDAFIRDASFQFSERYFNEKFLEPISMTANLMPPLGFIGTIMGMVIHFLTNTGTLNSELTIAGIATALYTTFIALICFTFLEFLKKVFYSLAHKRIDEGLSVVAMDTIKQPDNNIRMADEN